MRSFLFLFSVVLTFLPSICLGSNVVDLDPKNFDQIIDGSTPALVEFFAPWCGHCKNLAPVYEELGDAFAHVKQHVTIAKVDADAHGELGQKFGVKGFPTLKWFSGEKGAEPEDYSGGRDLNALASFIQSKTGFQPKIKQATSSVLVLGDNNFNLALNESSHALVEFYAPWCGHCKSLAPIYEKLGQIFANEPNCLIAKVDSTENTKISSQYKIEGYPTLKFFSASDKENPVDYAASRSLDAFVSYLNEKCGTSRLESGRLSDNAGVLDPLVAVVSKFAKSSSVEDKKKVAESVKAEGQKFVKSNPLHPYAKRASGYYQKVMKKILEKGEGYVKKEYERLGRLLASNEKDETVASAKVDDFTIRRNVLSVFLNHVSPAAERDEL